ncbi:MAG: DNA internalization-related competence protein ComEC/Rec2 [Bryobacteraceae bacterium]|nr:DNA internalization-related competence protein ComEC/Rec2 [Bryobacteraceae bacterium]
MCRIAGVAPAEAGVCLLAGLLGWILARQRRGIAAARFSSSIAWCAAGALAAALQPPDAPPVDPPGGRIEGCVAESSVIRNDRFQFTLEIRPGSRVRVSIPPDRQGAFPAPLLYGERVAANLRLRRLRGYRNPGAFDAAAWMARRGIFWNAVPVAGQPVERLPGACGAPWRRAVERLRARALARIDEAYGDDSYRAAMMRGLLLGDKSGIRRAWIEDFRRTGTYHALVISGSHVTLVCALFLLWRRVSGIGWRTVPAFASALAWLYALLAGADPPVLRAAAGFTMFAAASLVYRRLPLLNTVAVVAILFLALDPDQLFDASFQLSFLAVAALGALGPQPRHGPVPDPREMAARLEVRLIAETLHELLRLPLRAATAAMRAVHNLLRLGWNLLLASAAVQLSLALPMALLFHRLSLSGLSANVVVTPLVSLAIPAGFAAAITGWRPVAELAGRLLDAAKAVAAWHARLEPDWRIPDPPLWLGTALLLALLAWAALRGRRLRWLAAGAYLALLALLAGGPFPPRQTIGALELAMIDVGQGESLLVGLPDGRFALVDGGGLPERGRRRADPFDVGEEVVSPYLWHRGIRRVDVIAVTHLHEDHAGGVPALVDNFRPREVWVSFAADTPLWRRIEAAARRAGARIRTLREGDRCDLGSVSCRVLAPARGQDWTGRAQNNDSLVLELRHGRHAFLLTGDIEAPVEARLAEEGLLRAVQVLKTPHHGSRRSATEFLLEKTRPAVALISAGEGNSYGLPHPDTLARLHGARALVMRTDLDGLVTVRSDGRHLEVERGAASPLLRRFFDWQ